MEETVNVQTVVQYWEASSRWLDYFFLLICLLFVDLLWNPSPGQVRVCEHLQDVRGLAGRQPALPPPRPPRQVNGHLVIGHLGP